MIFLIINPEECRSTELYFDQILIIIRHKKTRLLAGFMSVEALDLIRAGFTLAAEYWVVHCIVEVSHHVFRGRERHIMQPLITLCLSFLDV
tara:strand:- start:104 stop:376 length:273 start_codon:yes stop_codon:yes gene_type:complete